MAGGSTQSGEGKSESSIGRNPPSKKKVSFSDVVDAKQEKVLP